MFFLHNFLPKVEEGLGVDYETVKSINKEIVYVTISGYGRGGSRLQLP